MLGGTLANMKHVVLPAGDQLQWPQAGSMGVLQRWSRRTNDNTSNVRFGGWSTE